MRTLLRAIMLLSCINIAHAVQYTNEWGEGMIGTNSCPYQTEEYYQIEYKTDHPTSFFGDPEPYDHYVARTKKACAERDEYMKEFHRKLNPNIKESQ